MTDFVKEFSDLAATYWGMDLRADWAYRSDGFKQWTITAGNQYSQEKFRQLASRIGAIVAPESSDPVGAWLEVVRGQPGAAVEVGPLGLETMDGEPIGVQIALGTIYKVAQASELAAANLPAPPLAESKAASSTPKKKAKKKRGRRSKPGKDKVIAEEYRKGLQAGTWKRQADYVRQRHPEKDAAWMSKLLSRAMKN